jgi:two-component system sensor histidine kinase/response regulator
VAGEGRVAVLLVDDRPENLVALEAMLSDMPDVSLAKAASGQDALRSVLREDFAAILMDVQMPGMDGFETAELIRANPKTRHMPIIFVTAGMGDADSRQQAYRQGAVDFLTKPLEPAIVRSKVRVFCDLYAQRQMIAQHGEQMEALVANRTTALQRSNVELALERDRYREMSAKFELATSGARLGVWDCDLSTGVLVWDARMHELYGLAPADFGGDHASWIACVHPDDRTFCEASIRRALQREREYDIEFRICRPDGAVRHIKASAHVVFDDKGRALRMTGINQDITDIKQIEQEVRAHRDRLLELVDEKTASLRAVVDHAAEGIITTDSTGVILGFNLAAERMFGHAAAAVIGRRVNVLMPSPHDGQHESYIQRYLGGASSQIVGTGREAVGLRADGSIFPIYIAVSEFAVGGELRFAAIVHDISKQKALEANLVHAREVAEAANQAKGSFLANMSHEIRTPLNAIIGLAHLLRWSGLTVEQRERLGKIDSAANHLLSVINDILDLSKIDAGKLELEHVDFGLGAVLEYVRSLISDQAQAKGLTVAVESDGVPEWLHGDPTRLRQALLNFASNAVKFAEHGAITLCAAVLEDCGDSLLVRFTVQDEGIGIAEDKLFRVFHAFEQADISTSRRYGGTGLGLAITRRLAEMMGGEVGVKSELGVGSLFWFTARLARGRGAMPPAVRVRASNAESELRRRHAGARLLLAEDHPVNREVALELLHCAGLSVDVAVDGREAVDKARVNVYDLILMDVQMPQMDGLEATRAIRSLPARAATPVLAMTASAFDEDRRACEEAGMNGVVTKPVNPEALFSALLKWLPEPSAPAPLAATANAPAETATSAASSTTGS